MASGVGDSLDPAAVDDWTAAGDAAFAGDAGATCGTAEDMAGLGADDESVGPAFVESAGGETSGAMTPRAVEADGAVLGRGCEEP